MTYMNTNARQLCALGFCAFTVPAVLTLPQLGWFWAITASAAGALFLLLLVFQRRRNPQAIAEQGKYVLLPVLFWNLLMLGVSAARLCDVYPTGNTFPLVGLLLLLLAVYAAQKGAVLRVGAIVFFFLVLFFALILGFSLPNLHMEWLKPAFAVDWTCLPIVLVPTVALYLYEGKDSGRLSLWLLGGVGFAGLCALVTVGSLSNAVAASENFAFYSAAKSVSVLGAMERLEPLVSAAMTAAGFCLLALLCAVNGRILERIFPKGKHAAACLNFFVGGGAMWLSGLLPGVVFAIGTTIFWGIFPLVTLLLGARKKF